MLYHYSDNDKVSIIKIDKKIIPIMISNKKKILVNYMNNVRKVNNDQFGIYYINAIIEEYPKLFTPNILGTEHNIEDLLQASSYEDYILPNVDINIILNSAAYYENSVNIMLTNINRTIESINSTNSSINIDLLKSLKESKIQIEKALSSKKKSHNLALGYELSNPILSCNIYDYISTRNNYIESFALDNDYKNLCTLDPIYI